MSQRITSEFEFFQFYYFFRKSAQREIIPKAKKRDASSQFCFLIASIKAIPKKIMNTAMLVNVVVFIFKSRLTIITQVDQSNNKILRVMG